MTKENLMKALVETKKMTKEDLVTAIASRYPNIEKNIDKETTKTNCANLPPIQTQPPNNYQKRHAVSKFYESNFLGDELEQQRISTL